jgi:hypothetical protein
MLTMTRWSAAVAAAILSVMLAGCSDRSVSIDEIGELQDLRDVDVTVATEVFDVGRNEARIGTAGGINFAVVVGDENETPRRVTIDGRSYRFVVGCAGAAFYAEGGRFSGVVFTVSDAAHDKLAPDAHCEG